MSKTEHKDNQTISRNTYQNKKEREMLRDFNKSEDGLPNKYSSDCRTV
jgi:hypothetical protein